MRAASTQLLQHNCQKIEQSCVCIALEKQFPKYKFKGICLQSFNEIVFQFHRMLQIAPESQLAFTDFDRDSKKWVISLLNRAIVVDKNGTIIEGFGNFSAPDFVDSIKKN